MDFVESTTDSGSKILTVSLKRMERRVIASWSEASRVYPDARPFDSDFIRFAWFKKYSGDSKFTWIDYGSLGTLGGIPILGISSDRKRYYIAYAAGKGLNVMKELLEHGQCRFVDIPSVEARVLERKEIVTGGLPYPGLTDGDVQADGAS